MSRGGAAPGAAIVLAGGRSARMGRAKACLEWEGSTLLAPHRRHPRRRDRARRRRAAPRARRCPPLPAGRGGGRGRPSRAGGRWRACSPGSARSTTPTGRAFVCAADMPLLDACRRRGAVLAALGPATRPPCRASPAGSTRWRRAYRGRLAAADRGAGSPTAAGAAPACSTRCGCGGSTPPCCWPPALAAADRARQPPNVNTPGGRWRRPRVSPGARSATGAPAAPSSSSPSQASAVAPASEVTA